MKADKCMLCGGEPKVFVEDRAGGKPLYGAVCPEGHYVGASFGTKNRAINAWNECQAFIGRYTV